MKRYAFLLVFSLSILVAPELRADVERLVAQLESGDEKQMIEARQMLAYEAPEYVARAVAPLLAHENAAIWRAAWNVLRDAGSEAGKPGREDSRILVTDILFEYLHAEQPEAVKRRVLQLLPAIVSPHHNVQPIATLLQDSALREEARTVLTDIGSTRARTALQQGLAQADDDFRAALIDALTAMNDPAGLQPIVRYRQNPAPQVQAAVARAIGRLGGMEDQALLHGLQASENDDVRLQAERADIMLLERMGLAGGHWPAVIAAYTRLLRESNAYPIQSAAITGLGRFGDENAVDLILEHVSSEGGDVLEGPALEAFRHLDGRAPKARLAARFEGLAPGLQLRLLALFGEHPHAVYEPALLSAARAEDRDVRIAALYALSDSDLPEAPALLAEAIVSDDEKIADAARKSLRKAAADAEAAANRDIAGQYWLRLYRHATTDEEKGAALEGIKRNPVPEAADILLAHLDGDTLGELPVATGLELIQQLEAADRVDEAQRLTDTVFSQLNHPGSTQAFIDYLHRSEKTSDYYDRLGFVRDYHITGAFPWDSGAGFGDNPVNAPEVDLQAEYETRDGVQGWTPFRAEGLPALVDLSSVVGAYDNSTAYAHAVIFVEEDIEATVRIGSDDGFKLWVNGVEAGEHLVDRGSAVDQDSATASLTAGENTILIQITQGAGGWNFMLRLCGPSGRPLPFTQATSIDAE